MMFIHTLTAVSYPGVTYPWILWIFAALSLCVFGLTFFTPVWRSIWENINGNYNKNKMRRLLMFNQQPYYLVLYIALSIIVSAISGAILLFGLGCVIYLLLWFIKILLWILIFIGVIMALGGIIALVYGLIKDDDDGIGLAGLFIMGIGGGIVSAEETLNAWGNICVEAGFNFFNASNLWDYSIFVFSTYWLDYLIFAFIPIGIGLIAAVLTFLCTFAFAFVEKVVTLRYNIKHPCPFCHNPSEPAVYLSHHVELPIRLRPSIYGLFHITHPETGEKMPTMLFNGRDKLSRKCPHCNRIIGYKTGIEKHIAFVGLPESGKTCLTYRFVGNLMKSDYRIKFTDEVSNEAQKIILDIKRGKEQELASKTSVNDMRRSLQILVPGKAPLPYHFFINDVGGELFTTSGVESNYMQFFKDVDSVSFLIDPFTMDFSEYETSGDFANWYKTNILDKKQLSNTTKFSNVLHTVKTMVDQFAHKTKDIHVNIILVKSDTGYRPKDVQEDEVKLKDMVINQMGMAAEVMDLENTYASLHYYAVSSLKNTGIDRLTKGIIKDLKIR